MLKRTGQADVSREGYAVPASEGGINVKAVYQSLLRQWKLIVACSAAFIALALVFLAVTPYRYTAQAQVLIDTRKTQLLKTQQVVGDQVFDAAAVDSQVEIIRSENVALATVRELKLADDPEFNGSDSMLPSFIANLFGPKEVYPLAVRERIAMYGVLSRLQVKRVGLTYLIGVNVTSLDRVKAAQIANALCEAYIEGELAVRYETTMKASRWLQERLGELREQARLADTQVQKFKADNNLVQTMRGSMTDQQLSDVNTQLIQARAATAETKAKLDRILEVSRGDVADATITEALKSDIITRLRNQYLDLAAREADISRRFGPEHTTVVNIRNQSRELRRSISDEIGRIAQSYKSEYEIARARETSLQESLNSLVGQSAVVSQAQIKLRDLESSAQNYRALYDNFLQRSTEASQQESLPVSEARLVTRASPPGNPSSPKPLITILLASVAGALLGCTVSIVRDTMDVRFRTGSEVETVTGLNCFCVLPAMPEAVAEGARPAAPPGGWETPLSLQPLPPRFSYATSAPFSRYAEGLRSVKIAMDLSQHLQGAQVFGMTSSVPNEGKSTVAGNLAQLIASTGRRVILVDADLRNPSLSREIAPNATGGLVEVLAGVPEDELIRIDQSGLFSVLPAGHSSRVMHSAERLFSGAMHDLISRLRAKYDYVIVDLPPVMPVVDVKAASYIIDEFVFVVRWGQTTQDAVKEAFSMVDGLKEKTLGIILNNADEAVLRRIEHYKGRNYHSYYS